MPGLCWGKSPSRPSIEALHTAHMTNAKPKMRFCYRLVEQVWLRLQHDQLALALFALAVIVMTYPLVPNIRTGLPSTGLVGRDIYNTLWQKWWLVKAVTEGHNPNFTPYLFYPQGLDITFQPRRWAAFGAWIPLAILFGDIAGYNLNVLLGLLVSAYMTYLLLLYLTQDRQAAWIGGAFYAFYPQHIQRALGQPNTGSVQWIPLFMLALIVALRKLSKTWTGSTQKSRTQTLTTLLLPALALSLNAYISIKVWMLAALLGALYAGLSAVSAGWWKVPTFWSAMLILLALMLLLVMPVAYPFLQSGRVDNALNTFNTEGADLYSFIMPAPGRPPLAPPYVAQVLGLPSDTSWYGGAFHVGLTSIGLVIIGVAAYKRKQSRRIVWLILAVFLWILTLGAVLHVNTVPKPKIWTPYQMFKHFILFRALRQPKRFALIFALPWAVLVGYGAAQINEWLKGKKRWGYAVLTVLAVLMLYEVGEMPWRIQHPLVSPFHYDLQVNEETGAIIDLPMGRNKAKRYDFLQTIHERPIVEGVVARMPEEAYQYINAQPLLLAWRQRISAENWRYDPKQVVGEIYKDGFRYILVHEDAEWLTPYFANMSPVYEGPYLTAYTVADLRDSPPATYRPYQAVEHRLDVQLGNHITLLGYKLSSNQISTDDQFSVTLSWQSDGTMRADYHVFVHLLDSKGQLVAQHDGVPRHGERPTWNWLDTEVIVDKHMLASDVDLPPGTYTLTVGMYDYGTKERLPAIGPDGERWANDRIVLNQIRTVKSEN